MNSTLYPVHCYVLAGGRSRRLGQDKARATIAEETSLIEAVIEPLEGVFSSFTLVARERQWGEDLGFRTITDRHSDMGPLGGISRALEDAGQGYIFVISCDRIGLQPRWVQLLRAQLVDEPRAVCFHVDERHEPLFAFYHCSVAGVLADFLERGGRAVWRFLDEIDVTTVDAPPRWNQSFSVNTPEQLQRARRWYRQ